MVAVAVLVLNLFHPGWCFADGYNVSKGNTSFKSDPTYDHDSEAELGSTKRQQPMMVGPYRTS